MLSREDLIRMADKAGFDTCRGDGWPDERLLPKIKEFAAMLREKMIADGWRQCAQGQKTTQHCAVAEQARQEERQACAQECDAVSESANKAAVAGQYLIIKNGAEDRRCAAAIRARGQA